jgi:hypothetical protein
MEGHRDRGLEALALVLGRGPRPMVSSTHRLVKDETMIAETDW